MTTTTVKVSSKYQIAVPQIARKKLNIKQGDLLLVDVQDGMIILIPLHHLLYFFGEYSNR